MELENLSDVAIMLIREGVGTLLDNQTESTSVRAQALLHLAAQFETVENVKIRYQPE